MSSMVMSTVKLFEDKLSKGSLFTLNFDIFLGGWGKPYSLDKAERIVIVVL